MQNLSRRRFLASTALVSLVGAFPTMLTRSKPALAGRATTIRVGTRVIEVNGRPATVYGMTQPDGSHGLITEAGRRFQVRLENPLDEETLIHWHGMTPPWRQDGVPGLSQPPLAPRAVYEYDFLLERPGTNWMHSHHGLQEQRLMAAPLVIRDSAEANDDVQEVVVLFHDFTFREPDEILAGLKAGGHGTHVSAGQGSVSDAGLSAHAMNGMMLSPAVDPNAGDEATDQGALNPIVTGNNGAVHLHDVEYDAFLANDRTLDDPEVFRIERGGRVRLRLINGATATNFWIDLDSLDGNLVAVDGIPVERVIGRRFEFAIAQRLDIVVTLPQTDGAWPVFAVREGDRTRTGFILATRNGVIPKFSTDTHESASAIGLELERRLHAMVPLAGRNIDRRHKLTITEAPGYVWMLNGAVHGSHDPLEVRNGERVEIAFVNQTRMAHPMHLHGHHFQVVAINGEAIAGAVRDTVLVPARGAVTVAFDASNPGKWALHCHQLYHMAAGMMTTIEYRA